MLDLLGERLIFLISQPRAGSTLLQRILACHPEIHTASEPWLMLHPLFALRPDECETPYNSRYAHRALQGYLADLPGGEETFYESVRLAGWHLYSSSLDAAGARYFLDKTPRYYLILPELHRTFPRARYIFLLRNPLAVLVSVCRSWLRDGPHQLYEFRHDLLDAPRLLAEALDRLDWQAATIHYEQLIADPERALTDLGAQLKLDLQPDMIDYGRHELPHWKFGDQETVYHRSRPDAGNENAWLEALDDPQLWRFAADYLEQIPPETLQRLGYHRGDLRKLLEDRRPGDSRLTETAGMAEFFDTGASGASYRHLLDRLRVADEQHFQLYERAAKAEDRAFRLEKALEMLRSSKTYRRLRWGLPRLRLFDEAVDTALMHY